MKNFKMNTWISQKKLTEVRAILKTCPDEKAREEGLACLKNAKPNFLCNLFSSHPDAQAALRFIVES